MSKFRFHSNLSHSIGIELEMGIVDAESYALASRSDELLTSLPESIAGSCKHKLTQACVEVISGVCHNVAEAREDLSVKLRSVQQSADNLGLGLWWGATHPFSHWQDQVVTDDERYKDLVSLLQEMARRLVTFGLHVHVGVDSGDVSEAEDDEYDDDDDDDDDDDEYEYDDDDDDDDETHARFVSFLTEFNLCRFLGGIIQLADATARRSKTTA